MRSRIERWGWQSADLDCGKKFSTLGYTSSSSLSLMRLSLCLIALAFCFTARAQSRLHPPEHPFAQGNTLREQAGGGPMAVPVLSTGAKPRTIKTYRLQPGGAWALTQTTALVYTPTLLPLRAINRNSSNVVTDSSTYTYDARGWLTSERSSSGNATAYLYTLNARNQLIAIRSDAMNGGSSLRTVFRFVYNGASQKIDTIQYGYLRSGSADSGRFMLRHNAQGNLTGITDYTYTPGSGWLLYNRINGIVFSRNETDIVATNYLPATPYSLETNVASYIAGQGVQTAGGSGGYDSIRFTGASSGLEYYSLRQRYAGGAWVNLDYFYDKINADNFLVRRRNVLFSDAGAIDYLKATNNTYTYSGNDLLEYVSVDSTQAGTLSVTFKKYVFSDFITASAPNLDTRLQAYPNPVRAVLTLRGCLPETPATVMNTQGKVVWTGRLANHQGTATISTEGWSPGLYLVDIEGRLIRFTKE